MPIRHGASASKNAITWLRRSCLLTTTFSAASMPWTWNTCLARSKPIVATCMWTAPHVIRLTTITLRHFVPRSGRRPPHHKLPSSALSRLLAHIEKCTIAWGPHREGSCMSGEGISTLAHRMINDVLRTSRRRFLTQVGAAGLGIGVPVSMTIAQETQRSLVGDGKEVSLGEKLARYATSLRYEDLPEDVIRIAKRTILDTLGCAFGGYSAGPSKIAMKLASDVNSKQPGTILLSGIKTSPELAVFANGVMIRYLDFNDAYVSQMNGAGHPSDTIAALLTAGELSQRSGRDLITATVLAYEVYCKIGDVFDYLGHGVDHT